MSAKAAGMSWVVRGLCACAAIAMTVGTVSCGGDGDSQAEDKPEFSAASEPPKTFITRMAKLLETAKRKSDCVELELISARSLTRFQCPAPKPLRKSMARFEVVDAEEYGTSAVVEYKSGEVKDGATIVLFVTPNRSWGVGRFGVIADSPLETDDEESRPGFDAAVNAYLEAVRKRDCAAFIDYAEVGTKSKTVVCNTSFPSTKPLAKRLKADPTARPKYQGGNAMFGFYTLETRKPKPQNVTISLAKATAKSAQPYVVLDVGPSPTAADQRRVRQQLRKQGEQKTETEKQTTQTEKQEKPQPPKPDN
jgi:hypothetical protein